jgi:hypothetical protein
VEFIAFAGFALVLATVLCGFALAWWSTAYDRGRLEDAWAEDDGARYRIEARGREAGIRTYVIARPTVAVFGELLIGRPGALDSKARALGPRLVVRARPRGDVTLGWQGGETNDARLDEALDVVRRVVRALGATYDRDDPRDREAV